MVANAGDNHNCTDNNISFPHSTPGNGGLQERAVNRKARQKAKHKVQKKTRQAKGFGNEPLQGPEPSFDPALKKAAIAQVGKRNFDRAMRHVVNRREAFLSTDSAIRAAATVKNGLVVIDLSTLDAEQTQAVIAYYESTQRGVR